MIYDLPKTKNKLVKSIGRLKNARLKNRSFLVEGLKNVSEALNSRHEVKFIVVSEDFIKQNSAFIRKQREKASDISFYRVSDKEFIEISDTVTPQGILAVIAFQDTRIEHTLVDNYLIFALDRIQDPGNMGTIIRTADAAGANSVLVGKGCVDIYNPKVVRSAMGSLFHIPIVYTDNLVNTLVKLKENGGRIVTTHLLAKKHYYDVNYKNSTVVVMGSEDEGVTEDVARISDELVKITMPGNAESLNVAIAHGIIAFEAVRQRAET
ncbi:MAG: TrmH family RNA methyltransferase [Tepidanaerobacteraceae bacterium]|jgi:TrmH family RNA methyltransferase|nr:RNA methyltransferase [Thermoanaerobacterales bacterium]